MFRLLDAVLFGEADESAVTKAEQEQWARHQVFPPVDVFDPWKGFLVEDKQTARLVFSSYPYLNISELTLKPGTVDSVLNAANNALNAIYESESAKRA
jgi:hypothetical protein